MRLGIVRQTSRLSPTGGRGAIRFRLDCAQPKLSAPRFASPSPRNGSCASRSSIRSNSPPR
ncbi:hypothetical protein [Lysobacter gummosus]|uniref:hypothetical protein n=1 Tax=Lysobacter gummosus TaxID=262324 RepID=UPI00363B7F37